MCWSVPPERPGEERRRRVHARLLRLLVGGGDRGVDLRRAHVGEHLVGVEAGDRRADRAEELVGHPAAVLAALAPVEQVEVLPEAALQAGGVHGAQGLLGVRPEEVHPREDELHLARADVLRRRAPGSASTAYSRQYGHWRSANSIIVAGAVGFPTTFSFCGMPLKRAMVAAAPGTLAGAAVRAGVAVGLDRRVRSVVVTALLSLARGAETLTPIRMPAIPRRRRRRRRTGACGRAVHVRVGSG